jgi:hypothetical protein
MLIIVLGMLSALNRGTLERNRQTPTEGYTLHATKAGARRPSREGPGGYGVEAGVKMGQGLVLAFFNSGQFASAVLIVSAGLASKFFLALASKKR